MQFLKKNTFLILNILVFLLVVFLLINYTSHDILLLHDRWCAQKDAFEFLYLGRFPGKLLNLFLYQFIPYLFPFINLNDLQCTLFAFVKLSIILIIVYFYTKIFFMFRDDNIPVFKYKLFFIVFLLNFFIIFNNYYAPVFYLAEITDSTTFFEWGLPLAFYSIFIYLFISNFIKNTQFKRKDFILITLVCILCSISNEMYATSAFFFLLYLSLFQLFKYLNKKIDFDYLFWKKYRQLSFYFYNTENNVKKVKEIFSKLMFFLFSLFVMLFSLILYILVSNYREGKFVGGGHSVDFISALNSLSDNLLPFINQYQQNYLIPYLSIHFLIILAIVYILSMKEKNYKKVVVISIVMFLGLMTFISLIILGGRSYRGQFFLMHSSIMYTYVKILLLILIMLLGYIFSTVKFNRKIIKSDITLCFIVVYFLCNILYSYFNIWLFHYTKYIEYARCLRIVSYASDKTALTFSKYDGSVYLPIGYYSDYLIEFYQMKFACYDCQNSIETMNKIKDKELKHEKSRLYSFDDFVGLENSTDNYYFLYLKYIYGVNIESMQFDSVGKVEHELKKRGSDVISTGSKNFIWFTDLNSITNKKIDYELLVNDHPNEAWALASRGRYYERNKQWDKALNDYTNAIKIDNDNINYYYLRSLLYKYLNKHKEAASDLQVVSNSNPFGLFANYLLIKEYELSGDYKNAIKASDRLIKIFPFGHADHEPDLYYERALLKEKIGDYKGAISDFIKSSEISEYSYMFDLYKKLGENFLKIKEYNDAIDYFSEQILYTPENYKLYFYRGKAFFDLSKYDNALDDYMSFMDKIDVDDISVDDKIKINEIKKSMKTIRKNVKNSPDVKYLDGIIKQYESIL